MQYGMCRTQDKAENGPHSDKRELELKGFQFWIKPKMDTRG